MRTIIPFMYREMWNEKRAALPIFFAGNNAYSPSVSLYACMKQIFLAKEDILLHIRFLNFVYSEGKITSVCF